MYWRWPYHGVGVKGSAYFNRGREYCMAAGSSVLIVGTESDNPFAIDIAAACGQTTDISDIVSLKTFANSEFCPRFISDEEDFANIGHKLANTTVVIVTTTSSNFSRNELVWRTLLVARAAKDNGAARVILVEPNLFFSAQDRGPRPEHGQVDFQRDARDYKKFDGQPFSSHMYAETLRLAGVDFVITVHNHSNSVLRLFSEIMPQGIMNLNPASVFADYIRHSDVAPSLHSGKGLLVCAPDKGAMPFTDSIYRILAMDSVSQLHIAKQRLGERNVTSFIDSASPTTLDQVAGKDVIVFDDMVRTGITIRKCCSLLKEAGAARTLFFVTHFYPSQEGRENLSTPDIDEIVTTNTLPQVLNRDMQGRLRRKLTVLKLEKWVACHVLTSTGAPADQISGPLYSVDMSSKNPRWSALDREAVGFFTH